MPVYDLCLAWEWQYDADFVWLLKDACERRGISLLLVTPGNLAEVLHQLEINEISFRALLDRATDTHPCFNALLDWARTHPVYRINPYGRARRAWDKAAIHTRLASAGIATPYTIVLPTYHEDPWIIPFDISDLGDRFSIKPAHGGGGKGVFNNACSWEQILQTRQEFPGDQYLLQTHIEPADCGPRRGWFRVIYCGKQVFPCWWDTRTHVYTPVTPDEERMMDLGRLREISAAIARITHLDLFSSEIALTEQGEFVVIDYVNDPIDLRLQSKACEGVPDAIVQAIACEIATLVMETTLAPVMV
jgi:hypothetical protein